MTGTIKINKMACFVKWLAFAKHANVFSNNWDKTC